MAYDVVSPLGRPVVADLSEMAAVKSHASGTIGFVWDQLFYGDRMFELWKGGLSKLWPGVGFAGPAEFGNIHDEQFDESTGIERLKSNLRQHGVTGAVIGVGA